MQYYYEIPPMCQLLDKKLKSTWWGDFRVGAELGGLNGIKNTYKRGLALAKKDKIYGTEFALVLNWLSWFYADEANQKKYTNSIEKARLFDKLFYEFRGWILDNWNTEDKRYFLQEID